MNLGNTPEEAIEEYPSRCSNCGHRASSFFIPDNYHLQDEQERDPGICTICGEDFGKEDRYEDILDVREGLEITEDILNNNLSEEMLDDIRTNISNPDSVVVIVEGEELEEELVDEISNRLDSEIKVYTGNDKGYIYEFTLSELMKALPEEAYMTEDELRR
jgi:hypothetical protein